MKSNPIFKPSKSDSQAWNLTKTLIHTSLFWLIFLILLTNLKAYVEASQNNFVFQSMPILGWILFALLGMLGLYSGYTMSWIGRGTPLPMDCPNKLVVKGPYRFVRNPMAVAGIGQGVAVGIILGSYGTITYALCGAFIWHFAVRPTEEVDLELRFGEDYINYKKKIKCWIPRFR